MWGESEVRRNEKKVDRGLLRLFASTKSQKPAFGLSLLRISAPSYMPFSPYSSRLFFFCFFFIHSPFRKAAARKAVSLHRLVLSFIALARKCLECRRCS